MSAVIFTSVVGLHSCVHVQVLGWVWDRQDRCGGRRRG
jgi:hypothetical protein